MTEEEILKNAGDTTRRAFETIFDSEYHILNENEELEGNYLLESPDFKSFSIGLTELIVKKGYEGDISDVKSKYKFLRKKCSGSGIQLTTNAKEWFSDARPASTATSREYVYRLCFALECTLEETIEFFYKVYFECPFNFRIWKEALYYFCFKNNIKYSEAILLCEKAEKLFETAQQSDDALLYSNTRRIGNAINEIKDSESLLSFFELHKNEFMTENKTAYDFAEKLIEENTELALEIYKSEYSEYTDDSRKLGRSRNIDLFLLVLFDFDMHRENKERSFTKESDFPRLVSDNFISKETISKILNHEKVSYDTMRKNLLLLEFFNYFAHLKIENEKQGQIFCCMEEDFEIFIDEADSMLKDCGYPLLYARNPFDWLIMHCANTADNPLTEFKDAIQAYYLKD